MTRDVRTVGSPSPAGAHGTRPSRASPPLADPRPGPPSGERPLPDPRPFVSRFSRSGDVLPGLPRGPWPRFLRRSARALSASPPRLHPGHSRIHSVEIRISQTEMSWRLRLPKLGFPRSPANRSSRASEPSTPTTSSPLIVAPPLGTALLRRDERYHRPRSRKRLRHEARAVEVLRTFRAEWPSKCSRSSRPNPGTPSRHVHPPTTERGKADLRPVREPPLLAVTFVFAHTVSTNHNPVSHVGIHLGSLPINAYNADHFCQPPDRTYVHRPVAASAGGPDLVVPSCPPATGLRRMAPRALAGRARGAARRGCGPSRALESVRGARRPVPRAIGRPHLVRSWLKMPGSTPTETR